MGLMKIPQQPCLNLPAPSPQQPPSLSAEARRALPYPFPAAFPPRAEGTTSLHTRLGPPMPAGVPSPRELTPPLRSMLWSQHECPAGLEPRVQRCPQGFSGAGVLVLLAHFPVAQVL